MNPVTSPKPIAITPGCPAGIGPDIVLMLAQQGQLANVTVIADPSLLKTRAQQLNLTIDWSSFQIEPIPLTVACAPGVGTPEQSAYVLAVLTRAVKGCLAGEFHAMVTGPVNKALINQSGVPFKGHTEWIADYCQTPKVIMMLAAPQCKVALVTTHIPLRQVADAITPTLLRETIELLNAELQKKFAIPQPRITITGLNPHAGENGYIGLEEIEVMIPVIQSLRQQGYRLHGPVSADTLFQAAHLKDTDCVLAMYHDQGLAPLKTMGFGETVNITLGLPIIRTSVDHGTAYSMAGTGMASSGSLLAALQMARKLQ